MPRGLRGRSGHGNRSATKEGRRLRGASRRRTLGKSWHAFTRHNHSGELLEILAASLVTRLTLDELESLWRVLAQRTEEKRRKELMATSSVMPRSAKNGQVPDAHNIHVGHHGRN